MKKTIFLMMTALLLGMAGMAQKTKPAASKLATDTFNVNGVCGMCKKNIEKAAKTAGAASALWSEETHVLTVKYNAKKTSVDKIQKQIAAAGYDNVGATAAQEAYDKLHGCCKYERKPGE
jgi:periplasmic mercuric ion binding protein